MQLKRLEPSLRKNLKDLLQGYVEHCEVSRHLMARIDFPIYYHGFKFGAPVFTHAGPTSRKGDRQVFGLLGQNHPRSQVATEIVLQFIEILTQHPTLAGSSVLRILPIVNPVALELEQDAPATEGWPILEHLTSQFQEQAADGLLEITSDAAGGYRLEGKATPALFDAFEHVDSTAPRNEQRARILVPQDIALEPIAAEESWHLKLTVPENWTDASEVHAVSRFIARLIRTYTWLTRSAHAGRP